MAMNNGLSVISAMDSLWYQQIILWSSPLSPLSSHMATFEATPQPIFPKSPSSSTLPFSPLSNPEIPTSITSPSVSSDGSSVISQQEDCGDDEAKEKEVGKPEKLPSSSFSTPETPNSLRVSVERRLSESMSRRSLGELEVEEVKGFMDLGFVFNKEQLDPHMVDLLPGLQRLRNIHINKQKLSEDQEEEEEEENGEEEKRGIERPYLSESWPIRRPDSPLLNLKVPKFSSITEMKKHLKFWAKTVASELHHDSQF